MASVFALKWRVASHDGGHLLRLRSSRAPIARLSVFGTLFVTLLVLAAAMMISAGASAGNSNDDRVASVTVKSAMHDGFARVVFEWRRLPPFQVSAADRTVTIRFSRPMDANLKGILGGTEGRIESAELSADGATVVLILKSESAVRSFPLSNMAVIDIVDPEPALPKTADVSPSNAATADPVEVGEVSRTVSSALPRPAYRPEDPMEPVVQTAASEEPSVSPLAENLIVAEPEPPMATRHDVTVAESTDHANDDGIAALTMDDHEIARATAASLDVDVETRDHGSFSRLIFSWPEGVDYSLDAAASGAVVVNFSRQANIDLAALSKSLPARFTSVNQGKGGPGLEVRLGVEPNLRLRHFQKGNRIVLDVMDVQGKDAADARPGWTRQEEVVTTESTTESEPDGVSMVAEAPEGLSAPQQTAEADTPQPAKSANASELPQTKEIVSSETSMAGGSSTDADDELGALNQDLVGPSVVSSPNVDPLHPPGANAPGSGISSMTASATSAPGVGSGSMTPAQPDVPEYTGLPGGPLPDIRPIGNANDLERIVQAALDAPAPKGQILPPAPPLGMQAENISGGVRLRLMWDRRVAAAVFQRSDTLWVVFDAPRIVDLENLHTTGEMTNVFQSADQMPLRGATVLRFAANDGYHPRVARSGNSWIVELTSNRHPPAEPLTIRSEPSAKGGGRLTIPVSGTGRTLTIIDPEIGDEIVVVPLTEPGKGVKQGRTFAQFRVLPSAQGAVFETRGDYVQVAALMTGIQVTGEEGLFLSDEATPEDVQLANVERSGANHLGPLFDYSSWMRDDLGSYLEAKQYLQNFISSATDDIRSERRMNLARFYFGHGSYADTIGVLQTAVADDADMMSSPDFLSLRGATLLMLRRVDEAIADLGAPVLDGDVDITLWRAAAAAERNDWETADSAFVISGPSFERLPPDLRAYFGVLAGRSALAVNNTHRAQRLLQRAEIDAPNGGTRDEARFLQAVAFQRAGKAEGALSIFASLAEEGVRPVKSRAELARVELMIYLGRMTRREAIDVLEGLRHAWRGDAFEQRLLRRLGELYREERDYLNALQAMRDAADGYPDPEGQRMIRLEMRRMFAHLFVEGGADDITPMAALTLYYEFGDLAPRGSDGGRIAEGLANRLVAVDLLGRAAELLENQLDALDGIDRARIGGRLATVHLLARDPASALASLDVTDLKGGEMPPALLESRSQLQAKAFAEINQVDRAVAVLDKLTSPDSQRMKADILWRASRWPEAATAYNDIFDDHSGAAADTTEAGRRDLLRLAIASSLSGDMDKLDDLHTRFSTTLQGTDYAEAFDLITRSSMSGDVPYRELPKALAYIDGAEKFMASYRDWSQSSTASDSGAAVN